MLSMMGAFAEFERLMTLERSVKGLRQRSQQANLLDDQND